MVKPIRTTALVTPLIILAAVLASFVLIAVLMLVLGINPLDAYAGMYKAAFGSPYQFSITFTKALPRLLAALGIAYALRGGLWNIGAEGQIYMGAMAASLVALNMPDLGKPLNITLACLAGVVGGGLWGAIPGVLKAYRGINEIITSLLSVYIAVELNNYLTQIALKPLNATFPASALFGSEWRLPVIWPRTILHAGSLIGLAMVILIAFIIQKTTMGFSLKTMGENPRVAEYVGMPIKRTVVSAMFISGAMAGLAGAIEVLGTRGRLISGLSHGYGFEAIAVALLGANNPWGIVPASLLFGSLDAGAAGLRTAVKIPAAIVPITEGVAVIFVLVGLAMYRRYAQKRQVQRAQAEEQGIDATGTT